MSQPGPPIESAYRLAREQYAALGVDTEQVLERLARISVSLHCWQGDDVGGFENLGQELGGGLAVTGNYPGKARTPDELRADLQRALALIPGRHRLNLHASYAELGGRKVERNELEPARFAGWIDWARSHGLGLDFNPTFFAHPRAADSFTLAHADPVVRQFWIEHGVVCRRIGAAMGQAPGTPCVTNVWIPDGYKDLPVDRRGPRERLAASLDAMFAEPMDPRHNRDAVEAKLFGIAIAMKLLGFVALYGMLLMPMGAVVFVDFWLARRLGFQDAYAERSGSTFNWVAGLAWFLTLATCVLLVQFAGIEIYFVSLPGWFVAAFV